MLARLCRLAILKIKLQTMVHLVAFIAVADAVAIAVAVVCGTWKIALISQAMPTVNCHF